MLGILWFVRPESLRKWLPRKARRKKFFLLCALSISMGFLLIKAAWNIEGVLAKVVVVFGFFAIFKGAAFLFSKASDKLIGWWAGRSALQLRLWAIGVVIFGIILLKLA